MKNIGDKFIAAIVIISIVITTNLHISYANEEDTIKVGWFYLPGYMEKDQNGSYKGYIYDYLMEIKKYTGWNYEFIEDEHINLYEKLKNNEIDILSPLAPLQGIDEGVTYTRLSIGEESMQLFTRGDSKLAKNDYDYFNGITVAANNDNLVTRLNGFANDNEFNVNIIYYNSYDDVRNAVIDKEVDAGLSGCYYSDDKTRVISNFSTSPFYFATNTENKEVMSKLNKSIRHIKLSNPDYESNLKNKYIDKKYSYFTLTKGDIEFINSIEPLTVSYTEEWAPYEDTRAKGNSGEFVGVVSGIFNRISELTGLKFVYYPTKEGGGIIEGIDLVSSFESNYNRAFEKGYNITIPYMETPVVLVKKDNDPTIDVKTAVSKYYFTSGNVVTDSSLLVYYNTPRECIEAVRKGEVEQAIVSSLFADNILDEFKYSGYYAIPLKSERLALSIAVRDDIDQTLINILNKAIEYIDDGEIDSIVINETLSSKKVNLKNIYNNMSFEVLAVIIMILFIIISILAYAVINRERYLKGIKKILYYDSLTGLLTRVGFEKKASNIIKGLKDDYYILYFNIVNFSSYNSLNGREKGDMLICKIASAIKEDSENNILVSRIYADNFVILLQASSIENLINHVKIYNNLHRGNISRTTVKLKYGIYKVYDANIAISDMIDCAIVAEQSIKNNYDVDIAVYDSELHNKKLKKDELASYFETAIENSEFLLYYQPKYDAFTEKVVGAEALVRWNRNGKLIYPNDFISVFEGCGMIAQLDFYMFEKACIKQKDFLDKGISLVPISINFSRVNLYDFKFISNLEKI